MATRATVDEQNFAKLKTFYTACMDTDTIKGIGIAPITDLVKNFSSVFPISDYASNAPLTVADAKTFAESLIFAESINIDSLFSGYVGADDKDPVSPVSRRHLSRMGRTGQF